jgi:3-dehydroquinate dehydratase-2
MNDSMDAIIINPGAFAHYSYAIRDAIESIETPTIEVHLSNILNREDFRKISVISDVCQYTIIGKGYDGYTEAVKKIEDLK